MAKAATKSPRKPAAPKADKAARPSPPDRDGDGASGGSLPGNETAPEALGSADSVLAHREEQHQLAAAQIADDGSATIIIPTHATGVRSRQPVSVNGQLRHLDIGVEVQVNAAELAVLEASYVDYETVVPLAAPAADVDAGAGAEGSSSAPVAEAPEPVEEPVEGGADSGENGGGSGEDPAAVTETEGENGAS